MKLASVGTSACAATVALLMTVGWPSAHISGIVTRVHAKHRGCSTASLEGTYAHTRTGINQVLGGPIAFIAVSTLDGNGNFTSLRETASRNGVIQDWMDLGPGGTYSVDTDCTGSFFAMDGSKINNIVVFHGGDELFLLSTLPGRIITGYWKRIDAKDEN
jgi:hypothetical protein